MGQGHRSCSAWEGKGEVQGQGWGERYVPVIQQVRTSSRSFNVARSKHLCLISRDGNRLWTAHWNLTAKYVRTVLQIKRGGWQREKELVHRRSHEISSHSMSQHHVVWPLDIRHPRAGVLYHISTGGLLSHWRFITYMRRIKMHSMPLHIDCLYGGFLVDGSRWKMCCVTATICNPFLSVYERCPHVFTVSIPSQNPPHLERMHRLALLTFFIMVAATVLFDKSECIMSFIFGSVIMDTLMSLSREESASCFTVGRCLLY